MVKATLKNDSHNCTLSLNQIDDRYSKEPNYQYSWNRIILCKREGKKLYVYLDGRTSW